MDLPLEGADLELESRLRRIRLVAWIAGGVWVVLSVIGTVVISDRLLTAYLEEASRTAETDSVAIAGVVNRMFHEFNLIPRMLSSNHDLRALVTKYDHKESKFSLLSEEERARQLKGDSDVAAVGARLTMVRNELNYDLVYVLDTKGIRIASSEWDRPMPLLGLQLADRDYFKEAMTSRTSQMFAVARTTSNPVMFFSAPLADEDGAMGVVVVRQDSEAIGQVLAGGRHVSLIVDERGMVVASSHKALALQHVGPLADQKPDAVTLRETYAQDSLRTLDVKRPQRVMHANEWIFEGRPYLLDRGPLDTPGFSLLVLSPVERLEAVLPLHYAIGVMVAILGLVAARLGERRAEFLARRRYNFKVTKAFNEKLEALNKDKDRYLGIAAHDLRNPLSSMRGLSELMLDSPLEPEQQREFIETIHRTSDEMLGLVNDLLDISVIESGKLDLKIGKHDVRKLVQQRLRHLEPYAKSKNIDIKLDALQGQHADIDSARFAQVVDNLVSNAIKFSPPNTAVTVAVRFGSSSFSFEVQDQGPGIPESDRKLLFKSFQKLSARPTAGEKSTGLGLAIVKKIIDAHRGDIDVDDAPGGGTRFTVTMPSTTGA